MLLGFKEIDKITTRQTKKLINYSAMLIVRKKSYYFYVFDKNVMFYSVKWVGMFEINEVLKDH